MDMNPNLAMLASMADPSQAGTGSSGLLQALAQSAGGIGSVPSAASGTTIPPFVGQPGTARRTANLNVPLTPAAAPPGPPATPNAMVPQGPPPTPNAPQLPQEPQVPNRLIDPQRVIRPVGDAMGAQGRKGDTMVAHLTPGDVVVPRQVRENPELTKMLNASFVAHGANPTAFEAGNRDASINPSTGLQEFGFLDMILPAALGLAGSAFLGPEILPLLEGAGLGGSTAAFLAPALGGGLGSTVGGIATGQDPLTAAASGFGGSLVSGAVGSAFPSLGGAPATVPPVGDPLATQGAASAATNAITNGPVNTGGSFGNFSPASDASGSGILGTLTGGKGILGAAASGLAGLTASNVIEGMLGKNKSPTDPTADDRNLQLTPLDQLKAKYSRILNVPSPAYLSTYGASPSTPAVRFFQ